MNSPSPSGTEPHAPKFERAARAWVAGFVRPHGWSLAGIGALSLFSTALGLAQPYLTKLVIDDGLLAGRMDRVVQICLAMLAVGVAGGALGALNRWRYIDTSGRILFALREAVFRHLLRQPPGYFSQRRSGDLMSRLDGDVAEIQRFSVDALLAFVNGVIALAGALALMIALSWKLSLLAFVLLPLQWLFLRQMRPRVEARTRRLRERVADISSFFFETLPATKFIQSVGAETRETERLAGLNRVYLGDLLRLQMTNFFAGTVPGLLTLASTSGVFIAGGYLMVRGELTLGTLIAFSAYLGRAVGPVQTLLGLYLGLRRAAVSLQRVWEVAAVPPLVSDPEHPRTLPPDAAGEICIEEVAFAHQQPPQVVLEGASLRVPAGSKVGLTGLSGVGKSTLMELLQRHYDPHHGRILLDGVDLKALRLDDLRRRVAVVAQDIVLFSGSLADNIRYAAPAASDGQVRAAAEQARLEDFVASLPDGLDTRVGERGATLSAGQRQRVAIARALLQQPLVLVLDEATSAVDAPTEREILAEVDSLFAGRTRLVITHRQELLANADLLVELKDGRLTALLPDAARNPPPNAVP